MPAHGIIALLPVKTGAEQRLRSTLNRIGNDIRGRRLPPTQVSYIDFPRTQTVHFARLALTNDPARGQERRRLLLATDFDGDPETHLAEIFDGTTAPEAVWGECEGFTDRASFSAFILAHAVEPQAYYIAFRGESVARIRDWITLRKRQDSPPDEAASGIGETLAALGRFVRAAWAAGGLMIRHGPVNALMAARSINATLNRVWWIRLFNLLTFNSPRSPAHAFSAAPVGARADCVALAREDEVVPSAARLDTPPEDVVSQNQLTLVTVVRPERLRRLRAVLAVINLFATKLATPGSLIGISTIHTVRWALVDGGRRLLMVSNYDNTWESYIDEFAEMILSGLDAIWENCYGYPTSGAGDLAALKRFLRCHQVPANVFYSAFPEATVLNIADASLLERRQPPSVG